MTVKYNTKKNEVTIRLSWTEVRQFRSYPLAVAGSILDGIGRAVQVTEVKKGKSK